MVEVAKDVTTTEEVAEEAVADLEAIEILATEVRLQEAEVSDQEQIVMTETLLHDVKADFHLIDQQEKADLEAQLHEENQVLLKEKVLQDVLKEVRIDQQVVLLTMLKLEDQEEVNSQK